MQGDSKTISLTGSHCANSVRPKNTQWQWLIGDGKRCFKSPLFSFSRDFATSAEQFTHVREPELGGTVTCKWFQGELKTSCALVTEWLPAEPPFIQLWEQGRGGFCGLPAQRTQNRPTSNCRHLLCPNPGGWMSESFISAGPCFSCFLF